MQNKSIRYGLVLLLISSLNTFAYAKETHVLSIVNASVNFEDDILYINGENFGENPEIRLDETILSIQFNSDNYIEATLPDGIEAGTYRLVVNKKKYKGKHHLFPIRKFIVPHGERANIDITIGVAGPQGPEGETGLQGDTGPQGLTGPTGPQGPRGETGTQGATGVKGDKGDTGPQGVAGSTGPQGLTGETGPQGATGLKGDTGDTGPQGVAGSTGPQGLTGETGPQGATGLKGDTGDTGPQGATGSKGDKGDKGAPGISNYGIVSKSASTTLLAFGGNSYALSVSCPSGKKVFGGGGKSNYNGDLLSESYPQASGNGWTIKYTNQSAYTKSIALTVYAICAECQ